MFQMSTGKDVASIISCTKQTHCLMYNSKVQCFVGGSTHSGTGESPYVAQLHFVIPVRPQRWGSLRYRIMGAVGGRLPDFKLP